MNLVDTLPLALNSQNIIYGRERKVEGLYFLDAGVNSVSGAAIT